MDSISINSLQGFIMTFAEFFNIHNTLVIIPFGSGEESYAMSWVEGLASVFGVLSLWHASQEKCVNYLYGLLSIGLFSAMYFQIQFYGLLVLQCVLVMASLYGWYAWYHRGWSGHGLRVRWMSSNQLVYVAALALIAILYMTLYIDPVFDVLTQVMTRMLSILGVPATASDVGLDAYPLLDSATIVLSVVAQIMMARKYAESWLVWLVVNVISLGIYTEQSVYALAIEHGILVVVSANGLRHWWVLATAGASNQTLLNNRELGI